MSDTKHHHVTTSDPVEHDAVSYSGIVWFVVILTATVLASQVLVWGFFEWFDYRVTRADAPRAATAEPPTSPAIEGGRLVSGAGSTPSPSLLVDEPSVLRELRTRERDASDNYGWVNQAMGTVRLPIERAKDLVLERGLPVRTVPESVAAPAAVSEP